MKIIAVVVSIFKVKTSTIQLHLFTHQMKVYLGLRCLQVLSKWGSYKFVITQGKNWIRLEMATSHLLEELT